MTAADNAVDRAPARWVRAAVQRANAAYDMREAFCESHGWRVCDACARTVPSVSRFESVIAGLIDICDACRSKAR